MQIPYSMDDSEPDLYGSLGGHDVDQQDLVSSCNGRDGGYGNPGEQAGLDLKPVPMFVFYSEEEMYTSKAFQVALGKTLKHKQRQIDELRLEILTLHERLEQHRK